MHRSPMISPGCRRTRPRETFLSPRSPPAEPTRSSASCARWASKTPSLRSRRARAHPHVPRHRRERGAGAHARSDGALDQPRQPQEVRRGTPALRARAQHRGKAPGYTNLVDYTTAGGRAFITHYNYTWIRSPDTQFPPTANWTGETKYFGDPAYDFRLPPTSTSASRRARTSRSGS